jgi:hypothetical protein
VAFYFRFLKRPGAQPPHRGPAEAASRRRRRS